MRRDPRQAAAVVALGLAVPGAASPEALWEMVLARQTAFRAATPRDFGADPELFYDPADPPALDKAYSLAGAWLGERPGPETLAGLKLPSSFDPLESDDSLLYWLRAGRLATAGGVLAGHEPDRVGVIAGHVILPTRGQSEAAISLYGREATRAWSLNPFPEPPRTNPFRAVGYSARLLSRALGLTGPAFTVDAACASSLYAARLALDRLFNDELSCVITGGLAQADPLFTQLGFSQLRALSRSGVCRPFDHRADGLVVGSGAAAIVLKTLERALADGDEIYALLLGVGLGNDRTGNLLAPDPEGQARVMTTAFQLANRSPTALGLIEAHGTSTILGDRAEVAAIRQFLSGQKLTRAPVLGSVKSNVGHLLSAAGAVALVKTALALKKQILPPTAGFERSAEDLASPPALRVLTEAEPWPDPAPLARLAAVNAFGFGGVNAQAVLEEYQSDLWAKKKPRGRRVTPSPPLSVALIAARTMLAPWPSYDTLSRFWLTPEEPPMAQTRRLGALKTTGFFFQDLTLDVAALKLPPKELAEALPQQTLALKAGVAALEAAGLAPESWPDFLDRDRLGVFMGVEIDPRAADYALRWTAPLRAAQALVAKNLLTPVEVPALVESLRAGGPAPLTHSRVLGALGSLVASRLARYLGSGGPAFTLSEERDSGFRALLEAARQLVAGNLDLAVVGVVDTFGDPKTGYLAPRTIWVEGAAIIVLAGPRAAQRLAPLGTLTIRASEPRVGPLSGLFTLNRNAFYLRHHLRPLGRGRGLVYWLKNPGEERRVAGPGYELVEAAGREPHTLTVPPDPIRPDVWFYCRQSPEWPLAERLSQLSALLEAGPHRELRALTRDFWALDQRRPGSPALALQARDSRELAALLKKALAGEEDRDLKPRILPAPATPLVGEVALVFPGSGQAYKGLGRGLALAFPHVMSQLESEVADPAAHFQSELFWAPSHKKPNCREAILGQVNFGLLATRALESLGLSFQAALGYSLGETSGLVALGFWPDRDQLLQDLMSSPLFARDLAGELAAPRTHWNWPAKKPLKWVAGLIPRSEKTVRQALEALSPAQRFRAYILIVNTREEVTVGGEEQAVAALAQALEAPFFPIEEVAAVHAPTVGPVKEAYYQFHLRPLVPRPGLRLYSAAWAKAYEPTPELVAQSLTDQALAGHRWPDLIHQAYLDGVRYFIEIGPGSGTTRLIRAILGDRPHLAVSLAATAVDEGWAGLSRLLSELWLFGQIPDPWRGQPQPSPEPDPRFLAPINLDPPPLNWPTPLVEPPEVSKTEEPEADYLGWLGRQTQKTEPEPTRPAPSRTDQSRPDPTQTDPIRPGPSLAEPARTAKPPAAKPSVGPAPLEKTPTGETQVLLSRADCLEFALGSIEKVLGPEFREVDSYPSRVLLPAEPLMLVDRVLALEGQAKSLGPGRIVTERDIQAEDWYLESNRISPGLAIESGQADLLLSAYLGADFNTKGLARYRLLDAEVVFLRDLPRVGETARYDIRIARFFHHGETLMFRFDFDGSVAGEPLLTMRGGRAGFFTPAALESGRGLPAGAPSPAAASPGLELSWARPGPQSFSRELTQALREGDYAALGPGFAELRPRSPLLPAGRLALFDEVPAITRSGGIYGRGFIRSEARVDPDSWCLVSHFPGDEVMPGTLMYDAALQTLRLYLLTLGWVTPNPQAVWQPPLMTAQSLKCRGQVTPRTRQVAYEIHPREFQISPGPDREPIALAEAIMWADGRPIAEVRNLGLRLAGVPVEELAERWRAYYQKKSPAQVSPAKKPGPRPSARAASLPPPSTRRPVKTGQLFDKERLNTLISGRMSAALGPLFSRFDEGAHVARLPRAPYDFLDQAEVTQGQVGQVALKTSVTASWNPLAPGREWLLSQAGGQSPSLPYAALNEIALQACGFLSAYMGVALLFDEAMYFRNLGGEATVTREIGAPQEPLVTRATLTKTSTLGQMAIQRYDFATSLGSRVVYEGQTNFGFFSLESLQRQRGLQADSALLGALKPPAHPQTRPYPQGPAWPRGRWLMLEELQEADPRRLWAQSRINPQAWFFAAHFPGDPVWPGSLGLEAFFQAAKYLAVKRYFNGQPEEYAGSFAAPSPGRAHSWLYRGQIPPSSLKMGLGLLVSKTDPHNRALTFNGLMSVDDLVVYQVDNFTVALR